MAAAETANARQFIEALPDGVRTYVGNSSQLAKEGGEGLGADTLLQVIEALPDGVRTYVGNSSQLA